MADDIKKIIEEATEGLRKDIREVGVKVEAVQSDVKQVLEGVETHTQQLERIESRLTNLEPVRDDVEAIKVTVEGIKRDLKQKVDREEFSALEVKLRPA
mgnify:CR=1 FL=1